MSFWRKENPVIGVDGQILKGGMWPHQRKWWESQHFIKALVTGYGGGKTLIGAKRAIALALHNAPSPHLWVSPSYKVAKRTIIPTIKAYLRGRNVSFSYNKTDFEFTLRHRGRVGTIWVGSGQDPEALKGPNVGSSNIDEPFIQDRAVFEQIVARTRDPIARVREIGLTGTPEELNWGYDICEGDERERWDLDLVQASTRENRALPPEYVQTMERGYDPKLALAYIEGQFVNLSTGQVYYGFNRKRNIKEEEDPGFELHIGMDFNVNPMASLVFWKSGEHLHFMDEVELPNADTEFACSYWRDKYGERLRNVYPDATGRSRHSSSPGGKSDFYYIQAAGLSIRCQSENPRRRDRYNATNAKLCPPKGGPPTLTMSPKCKLLARYMEQHTYEKMKKQESMTHLLDAATYPVAYLFPLHRAQPKLVQLGGTAYAR